MTSEIAEDSRTAPTFQGRLQLESFKFKASSTAGGPRRSLRLSVTPSAEPSPSRASRSPSKRKALDAAGDDTKDEEATSSSSSLSASIKTTETTETTITTTTTTTTKSPSRRLKRARVPSTYAPPSTYAHLPGLPDAMAPNLLVLFIGLNPGIETARTGHAYAHPSNLFWKLLHSSGVTPRLCHPTEDREMPARYALGLTNIVARPSRNGAELSRAEMDEGVAVLERKVRRWRPESVCIVGKSIWESVWRVRHGGRAIRPAEFRYGWQDEKENMGRLLDGDDHGREEDEREEGVVYDPNWKGARVFVASSTSGLAATLKPKEKEAIWKELGDWVVKRRVDRAAAVTTDTANITTVAVE
ncbi:uracil-DNA glycosylase-like protein [Corynascus novoguineensis]|uniref:Uracil-DNA glycosylase-like protein n=1 Tax=Corynascus novoguineensis TaxID=1126955 RepID=A0AAN7HHN7_9PEZI|nr:uracil-DNA glycosylase-like protein [Corynascus novoguineensis]